MAISNPLFATRSGHLQSAICRAKRPSAIGHLPSATCYLLSALLIACSAAPTAAPTATPARIPSQGDPERGAQLFPAAPCSICHPGGEEGQGPPLYGPEFDARYPDDESIIRQVRSGRGQMPPLAPEQVSDPDLLDIIAFVRTLHK